MIKKMKITILDIQKEDGTETQVNIELYDGADLAIPFNKTGGEFEDAFFKACDFIKAAGWPFPDEDELQEAQGTKDFKFLHWKSDLSSYLWENREDGTNVELKYE